MSKRKFIDIINFIWRFSDSFRLTLFNLFISIFVKTFIMMLYPFVFGLLIDEAFYNRNMDFFIFIVIGYGVLFLGDVLLRLILNASWAHLTTRFLYVIRNKIFNKIFHLKASYLNNAQSGELIARINNDTYQIMDLINWNIFFVAADILILIMSFVMVAIINIRVATIMLLLVPVTVFISRRFAKIVRTNQQKYRHLYGRYIGWLFEMIGGLREVQLLAANKQVSKKFVKSSSELIRLKIKTELIEVGAERANAFIRLCASLALYIVAGVFIVRGQITVGTFVAVIEYFGRSSGALHRINNAYMKIQRNSASIDKIMNLLDEDSEEELEQAADIVIQSGKIEFNNIEFQYNDHKTVLSGINLRINEGEKVSIVGRSGAGKTTLVNLLLRFYEPHSGSVKVDGKYINEYSLKSLRRGIGIVQQDTVLFDGTIKYNLKLGTGKSEERELWEACERAYIADFIRTLPNGLDTVIGAEGIDLSGGQKQRLAIARIFLKNPKILIFDEATSALDYEAEQAVQKAWKELSFNRTTIIIAHRLSTVIESDKIAVIHKGDIVSFNHHLKLLESCEHYQKLFKEQYLSQGEVAS